MKFDHLVGCRERIPSLDSELGLATMDAGADVVNWNIVGRNETG